VCHISLKLCISCNVIYLLPLTSGLAKATTLERKRMRPRGKQDGARGGEEQGETRGNQQGN